MQPEGFLYELSQLVARRSKASHLVDTLAFVNEVAERLEGDPVFGRWPASAQSGAPPGAARPGQKCSVPA